eukprot:919489-Pelagomonas_calceolata.AAC.4
MQNPRSPVFSGTLGRGVDTCLCTPSLGVYRKARSFANLQVRASPDDKDRQDKAHVLRTFDERCTAVYASKACIHVCPCKAPCSLGFDLQTGSLAARLAVLCQPNRNCPYIGNKTIGIVPFALSGEFPLPA